MEDLGVIVTGAPGGTNPGPAVDVKVVSGPARVTETNPGPAVDVRVVSGLARVNPDRGFLN